MREEDWAELTAQADEHGYGAINFYLDDGGPSSEFQGVDVQNVMFEDNEIKVFLA